MTGADTLVVLAWAQMAAGVLAFGVLWFVAAPYGRFMREGWGPTLPSRWGWMLMKTPSAVGFLAVFFLGEHRLAIGPLALLLLWQAHYLHRAYVFPWRLRERGKRMPWVIVGMGLVFNCLNTWLNARWISQAGRYEVSWLWDPRFVAGLAVFVAGCAINQHADAVLFALRGPGDSGYRIPRGGLYRWVSCPNYLGEILEWTGWAVATWSLPGLAFAVFTFTNLAPRARATHRWYRQTFADYPSERKALVPFVL
jgi:protein-S-isoprenylcysteine O-methyltransferase Ste14